MTSACFKNSWNGASSEEDVEEVFGTGLPEPSGMTAMVKKLIATAVLAMVTASSVQAQAPPGPPPRGFKRVSDLVKIPRFMPGLGVLYVRPETLPAGPFLAYDRRGRRVSTIYMIPVADIDNQKKFDLAGFAGRNDHVSMYFNSGHPGVEVPHYHVVIWHVNKRAEVRVAR
jgi:hypothetical protein